MALPRSTAAAQGVDASGIGAFLDAAAADAELHSLMVVRHGHVVAEGWWAPYAPDQVQLTYSLSKSFTATALGLAVGEGLVDLDATLLSYFEEYAAEVTDARSRSMRVRDAAAMASGHAEDTLDQLLRNNVDDLALGFLQIPPDAEPGTLFTYNQPCTFILSAIIQRVAGSSLTDFLRPRLFDPLGIGETSWRTDRFGRELGATGLHVTTEAIAKLGQLYLDNGVWQGQQLLPPNWVAEATKVQIETKSRKDEPDWQRGYGFQFWQSKHGYRGDGAFGQLCLVLPEADAVVAITSETENMQALLTAAWTHLIPALTSETPNPRVISKSVCAGSGRDDRQDSGPVSGDPLQGSGDLGDAGQA